MLDSTMMAWTGHDAGKPLRTARKVATAQPAMTQIVLIAAALYLSGLTVERVLRGHWDD
jgi:hypothetical protein